MKDCKVRVFAITLIRKPREPGQDLRTLWLIESICNTHPLQFRMLFKIYGILLTNLFPCSEFWNVPQNFITILFPIIYQLQFGINIGVFEDFLNIGLIWFQVLIPYICIEPNAIYLSIVCIAPICLFIGLSRRVLK